MSDWNPCAEEGSENDYSKSNRSKRQWKASPGTLGGSPAAISLDKILAHEKDPYLMNKVTRIVLQWHDKAASIMQHVTDETLRKEVMEIYYDKYVARAHSLQAETIVKSHLCCVLHGMKKKFLLGRKAECSRQTKKEPSAGLSESKDPSS